MENAIGHGTFAASINVPCIVIRIQRAFRSGMSPEELYEATRGVWVVGPRRNNAKYAMAVFDGVVREVYEIAAWHAAGTTEYLTRPHQHVNRPGRWEFTGSRAPESVRASLVGMSIAHLWTRGAANPIKYVNC